MLLKYDLYKVGQIIFFYLHYISFIDQREHYLYIIYKSISRQGNCYFRFSDSLYD